MRAILLTRNQVALVDDDDYAELSLWRWHCNTHGYAVRTLGKRKHVKTIFMHRQIMNATQSASVVFRDNNPLNCRKANLLVGDATTVQRKRGRLRGKTTSRYKGVFRAKDRLRWFAQIKVAGRAKFLGSFKDEEKAAYAYDEAARRYFGPNAFTNFPINKQRICRQSRSEASKRGVEIRLR